MTKRKRVTTKRRKNNVLTGCLALIILIAIVMIIGSGSKNSTILGPTNPPRSVAQQPTEPPGVTIIPTVVNRSGFVTITPAPGTIYPTATITDTPLPTDTATDAPTGVPTAVVQTVLPTTYYVIRTVNVRSCASSTCNRLGQVNAGTQMTVTGTANGEAVTPGNTFWYQVNYGGTSGYIYGTYLTNVQPVQSQPQSQQLAQPTAAAPAQVVSIPHNCATARAMGLDEYQAAQVNPRLDRDGDHKACYDDQ